MIDAQKIESYLLDKTYVEKYKLAEPTLARLTQIVQSLGLKSLQEINEVKAEMLLLSKFDGDKVKTREVMAHVLQNYDNADLYGADILEAVRDFFTLFTARSGGMQNFTNALKQQVASLRMGLTTLTDEIQKASASEQPSN